MQKKYIALGTVSLLFLGFCLLHLLTLDGLGGNLFGILFEDLPENSAMRCQFFGLLKLLTPTS
jgi:hypothetical protein